MRIGNKENWTIERIFLALMLGMTLCLCATNAFAQDKLRPSNDWCPELLSTSDWKFEIESIDKLIEDGKYAEAEETIQSLESICARSPMLKYKRGKLLEAQGDQEKAYAFYVEASEGLTNFELNPSFSKEIWFARFAHENQLSSHDKRLNTQILWSGVGVGLGGIALLATGFGLAYSSDPVEFHNNLPDQTYSVHKKYTVGWGLAGAGIAMFVSGAIMSGVAGYRLSKLKNLPVALELGPTSLTYRMTF